MKRGALIFVLLVVAAFSLATWVQPRLVAVGGKRDADGVFKVLFGEGRRMFANHFAIKADVYLHSGFYPSIFDQAAQQQDAAGVEAGHDDHEHAGHADMRVEEHDHDDHGHDHEHGDEHDCPTCHKCNTTFMGEPRDWVEKFGRHFMVTEHAHLGAGKEREILPWLKLSAQLDPQRIETYRVGAFFLSRQLQNDKEAEKFLREGLRANPQSYEILFDLGKLYEYRLQQPDRARGVWRLALRRWDEVEGRREKPDKIGRSFILSNLGEAEFRAGNIMPAIACFLEAQTFSPAPAGLQSRTGELWLELTLPPTGDHSALSTQH